MVNVFGARDQPENNVPLSMNIEQYIEKSRFPRMLAVKFDACGLVAINKK
ncbi:MAG: hypothetical protein ACLUKN_15705 [Bacilli bacterium]